MSDGSPFSGTGPRLSGEQLAAIANELVRIKAEFYGKGPEQAKAYQNDDVLVCVMRGGLTTLERTLLAGGEHDLVRDVRVKFQDQMRSTFERAVARIVGRHVLCYESQITFDPEYIFELCVLGEPNGQGE